MDLNVYRDYFPVTKTDVYLNHAAVSPFSTKVSEAINKYLKKRLSGDVDVYDWLLEERQSLKKNIGFLIKAKPENIAIISNTSEGLNWLANSLEWNTGDRIILNDYEFPSNIYPFLNLEKYGVQIDYVKNKDGKILLEDIESAMTPNTKLLSISDVEFLNGFRNDLYEIGKICKKNNIIFSVDGIQGVGALTMDVEKFGIDFMSNGGHKWLMGPQGCGFMYIAKRLHHKLKPIFAGWLSVKDSWNFLDYNLDLLEDAGRYEIATMNALGVVGLRASTDLLVEANPENIENHLLSLGDIIIKEMGKLGFNYNGSEKNTERSGIYSFEHDDINYTENLFNFLKDNKIHISLRNGTLRISPHFYNNEADIEQFILKCKEYK